MRHSHLNDMEIPETKRFIPKGFELGTTLSWLIGSIKSKDLLHLIDNCKNCDICLLGRFKFLHFIYI